MILHYIVNLAPGRYYEITKRVDNTTVPSNLTPGEFIPPYASCDRPGPAEFPSSKRQLQSPICMYPFSNFVYVTIHHYDEP